MIGEESGRGKCDSGGKIITVEIARSWVFHIQVKKGSVPTNAFIKATISLSQQLVLGI